ncbi:MAG TPA: VWA domain-containing protein [Terriglobales bacterium]|nr:VWA domain-containing protein [Terriglobales bacterium]
MWKIRDTVDEVAMFFSATDHGALVDNLRLSDIAIRDDQKRPLRVLQLIPQAKLPLRLGLLVDVSGSLQPRFSFEKKAAERFLQRMLSNPADLAFITAFSDKPNVVQDFTGDTKQLSTGIEKLKIGGGTAIWDAVSYVSWKLAAYPDKQRVAKVLVVLTDGQDNLSAITLKQAIRDAEDAGVAVYAISTETFDQLGQFANPVSDADRVLQALAGRTGGEAFFPGNMRSLNKTFDRLQEVIRSRYLIAYKPANLESNGSYHRVTIVAKKDGKRLQVHARKGYYAPSAR